MRKVARPSTRKVTGRPARGRAVSRGVPRRASIAQPAWTPLVLRPARSRTGAAGTLAFGARPPAGFGFVSTRVTATSGAGGAQVAMGARVAGIRPVALSVQTKDAVARAGIRSYLACLAVAFVLAGLLVWSSGSTARLGYRVEELKTTIASLEGANQKLSFELSGYQSIARVEQEAIGRLGMVRPEFVRISVREAGQGTAPAPGQSQAGARVIRLTPDGTADASAGSAVADAERSGLGALWDRFYRWLIGAAQAEASGWR